MRARRAGWVLPLLAALPAGGCDEGPPPEPCELLCAQAASCLLFPSALGAGPKPRANCVERCQNSGDGAPTETLLACADADADAGAATWCSDQGGCARLGACLDRSLGASRSIAEGSVEVALHAPSDPASSAPGPRAGLMCQPATGPRYDAAEADEFCNELGASRLTILLHPRAAARGASVSGDCRNMLLGGADFAERPVGRAQVGVRIEGSLPQLAAPRADAGADAADDDGAGGALDAGAPAVETNLVPYCVTVWGSDGIVPAGTAPEVALDVDRVQRRLALQLPPLERLAARARQPDARGGGDIHGCENQLDACKDAVDNDGDGQQDCSDPDCGAFCGPEACAGLRCAERGEATDAAPPARVADAG